MRKVLGLLACVVAIATTHAAAPARNYELAIVDLQGQKKVLGTLPEPVFAPRISPDGKRVAFEQNNVPAPGEPQLTSIFVAELDKLDKAKQLQQTVISRTNIAPVWSSNGDWLAFLATGNGSDTLFRQRADGGIQPKVVVDGRAAEALLDGGEMNGGRLVYLTRKGDKDYGISMYDLYARKSTVLVDQPGSAQHSSEISPNGNWLAYASDETGRLEVWLEPLPKTGKRYQLTKNGGSHPEWTADGKTIFFDQGGQIYKMDVTTTGEPKAADPAALPIKGFVQGDLRRQYELMPDGKGFLMLFAK